MLTLPDHLAEGLAVVFVGANPSIYAAERGHYYARPSNRFWAALSRSTLSAAARTGLGVERLRPEHDALLLGYGIGFTDVVKRPSVRAEELGAAEWAAGASALLERLAACRPRLACFQTRRGYTDFARAAFARKGPIAQGLQPERIGRTRLFLAPSPSGLNAHTSIAIQAGWYDRLHAEARAARRR